MAPRPSLAPPPRLAYRIAELAQATGLGTTTLYDLVARGVIPRLEQCGGSILVPAWAVDSWAATGRWDHPDWRPVPPVTYLVDDGPAATVTPIRPDAS
jgi:excisionase family DNA binding protein